MDARGYEFYVRVLKYLSRVSEANQYEDDTNIVTNIVTNIDIGVEDDTNIVTRER